MESAIAYTPILGKDVQISHVVSLAMNSLNRVLEHGLSVGSRYDPDSIFFNRKCICDEDWSGDLCHIPIANICHDHGQYINGRCLCHGYYFGPRCQYVGKCINGKLQEGK
jgi:hypothetical protein